MHRQTLAPLPPNARRATSAEEKTSKSLLQKRYDAGHRTSQLPRSSWGGGASQVVLGSGSVPNKRNHFISSSRSGDGLLSSPRKTYSRNARSSPRGRSWGGGPSQILIGQPTVSQRRQSSSTRATRAALNARSMSSHANEHTMSKPNRPSFEIDDATAVPTGDVAMRAESMRAQQHGVSPRGRSWGGGPSQILIGQPTVSQERRSSPSRTAYAVKKTPNAKKSGSRSKKSTFERDGLGGVPHGTVTGSRGQPSIRGRSSGGGRSQIVIGDPNLKHTDRRGVRKVHRQERSQNVVKGSSDDSNGNARNLSQKGSVVRRKQKTEKARGKDSRRQKREQARGVAIPRRKKNSASTTRRGLSFAGGPSSIKIGDPAINPFKKPAKLPFGRSRRQPREHTQPKQRSTREQQAKQKHGPTLLVSKSSDSGHQLKIETLRNVLQIDPQMASRVLAQSNGSVRQAMNLVLQQQQRTEQSHSKETGRNQVRRIRVF